MNRKYNTAEFLACVERLRRYLPGCALTADMITGFPGETEADQAAAVAFLEQVGQTLPVLFETEHDGSWVGHSDNYCLVRAAGDDLRGLVKNVKISAVSGQMLVGDLV